MVAYRYKTSHTIYSYKTCFNLIFLLEPRWSFIVFFLNKLLQITFTLAYPSPLAIQGLGSRTLNPHLRLDATCIFCNNSFGPASESSNFVTNLLKCVPDSLNWMIDTSVNVTNPSNNVSHSLINVPNTSGFVSLSLVNVIDSSVNVVHPEEYITDSDEDDLKPEEFVTHP